MKTFEFSIIASGLDPEARDFADRFFNAGCDDATISFHKGHIIVDFAREADSVDGAISSAVECVKKAGAQVDRIEPDPLVSLSDIAARTGLTRAHTRCPRSKRRVEHGGILTAICCPRRQERRRDGLRALRELDKVGGWSVCHL